VSATNVDDVMIPRLLVISPTRVAGQVLLLSPPRVVIGHSDTADVVLDDTFVSRRHALVTVDESGVVTIRDLNSTGGTFVNDERLEGPRVLQSRDLVRFADLEARFEPGATAEFPTAASDALTVIQAPAIGTAETGVQPLAAGPDITQAGAASSAPESMADQHAGSGGIDVILLRHALMVDRDGMLNAASLDLSAGGGWQGPDAVGNASLVPGSPITVFQHSKTVFTALMVDRDGMLNAASLDLSAGGGWQGPDAVGNASLVPGSRVAWFAIK
jgi:hypothetical protein